MRNYKIFLTLPVLVLGVAAFRFTPAARPGKISADVLAGATVIDPGPAMPPEHQHHLSVHWVGVHSLVALRSSADLVVHGRVVAQRTVPGDIAKEPPTTISTIEIVEPIGGRMLASGTGNLLRAGRNIELAEVGGVAADGCLIEPADKPILRLQDEAVLFLSAADAKAGAAATQFHVIGGYEGRFEVHGDLITPLAVRVGKASGFAAYDHMPVSEFLSRTRSTIPP